MSMPSEINESSSAHGRDITYVPSRYEDVAQLGHIKKL